MKKKCKSLKTTWSDEDSDGSEEEDDHVRNYIAFQVTSKKNAFESVTPAVATSRIEKSDFNIATTNGSEFDLDSSDGEELSTKDIQKAYQIMYENWIKVCKANKA